MFDSISVPLDQVSYFLVDHSTVQDLLYDPLFLSVYDFWQRGGEVYVNVVLGPPVLGSV